MDYWVNYMKSNEIPISFLYGISDFYQQFGFEYAAPAHFCNYVNIEKTMLENIKGKYKVEKLHNEDEEAITQIKVIYDRESMKNFCSEVRSLEYFKYRIENTYFTPHEWYVVKSQDGVKGYLWLTNSDKELTIREAHIVDEVAGESLCAFLNKLVMDRAEIKTLNMKAPLNNSFAKLLFKKGGKYSCSNELYPGTWGAMYKIVDLKSAMKVLKEALEERLRASKFYNFMGMYRIVSENDNTLKRKVIETFVDKIKIYPDRIDLNFKVCMTTNPSLERGKIGGGEGT